MNDRGVGKVDLEVVSDPSGTPLQNGQAYFVRYKDDQVGPFFAFADAAAMHEALRQGHPRPRSCWTTPATSALPLPFFRRPERPLAFDQPQPLVFPFSLGQCRKS